MPSIAKTYPKGSEWRKWDLHLHTPSSALNNRFGGTDIKDKWERYIATLESLSDIAVLGVTDYFSIDGFNRLTKERLSGRLTNIDLIIPNVELRVLPATQDGHAVNLHVLFNPAIADKLESLFFQSLVFAYKGNEYRCDRPNIISLGRAFKEDDSREEQAAYCDGVEQFKVDFNVVGKILKRNDIFRGNYLVAVSNRSKDGNSGFRHSSLVATREEMYRLADAIFSSNPNDIDYFLGKGVDKPETVIEKYGSLKPCIHGSDAHKLESICLPDDDRFTWIKADPSFEGLKQIIFEPEERVRIQKENPCESYPKAHFSKVIANGPIFEGGSPHFSHISLDLNDSLIAIIGGRGTGKSLLLDVLHHTFKDPPRDSQNNESSRGRLTRIASPEFTVSMTKPDDTITPYDISNRPNQFDYLHVRQGDVKELAEDPNKLAESINLLLGYSEGSPDDYFEQTIGNLNHHWQRLVNWHTEVDENGNLINGIDYNNKRIGELKDLIDTVTTRHTKQKIQEFTRSTQVAEKHSSLLSKIEQIRRKFEDIERDINHDIQLINQHELIEKIKVPAVDFQQQYTSLNALQESSNNSILELTQLNEDIAEQLSKQGIKGDIPGQLKKVETYQREIEQHNEKLLQINKNWKLLGSVIERRKQLATQIRSLYADRMEAINDLYRKKSRPVDSIPAENKELISQLLRDIDIHGEIYFDKQNFLLGLKNFFDGRKVRNRRVESIFTVSSPDDFFKLLNNEPIISDSTVGEACSLEQFAKDSDLFYSDDREDFFNFFYLESKRRGYLRVIPRIKYKGKSPQNLSVGQRGTFFVCLKLATETFTTPFVFDQPEDDLDNEFIVQELQPVFREIKKYRQVIIVTHNANLVVNADAEQIIVADNQDEKISVISGSLEDFKIRTQVCRVLEGGEAAFKKREARYNLT